MRARRPGSVTTLEPKIIWVKMIDRPGANASKHMKVLDKFNAVLEEALHKTKSMYIMSMDHKIIDKSCFDLSSGLNSKGKCAFWGEFDCLLRKFDKQEISLRPQAVVTEALKHQELAKK